MAIITTSKALGWYGVHGENNCVSTSLPNLFGSYSKFGDKSSFKSGTAGLTASDFEKLQIWQMMPDGRSMSWYYIYELYDRHTNPSFFTGGFGFDKLECGKMYWIIYTGSSDLHIPGFIPTAHGIDMGRVSV